MREETARCIWKEYRTERASRRLNMTYRPDVAKREAGVSRERR